MKRGQKGQDIATPPQLRGGVVVRCWVIGFLLVGIVEMATKSKQEQQRATKSNNGEIFTNYSLLITNSKSVDGRRST